MNTRFYLLVLNATEGFLQLAIGDTPDHLLCAELEDGFEESGKRAQQTQKRGGSPLKCSQEWRLPSQGTELLAPALGDVAARLGIEMAQISHIACVTGPGSFTGIRLTTTSAGGLAMATGALMGGLAYLPLLAANACLLLQGVVAPSSVVWVVTHARRDLVHAQAFELVPQKGKGLSESVSPKSCLGGDSAVRALQSEVLVLTLDELAALVDAQKRPALLLGSGITRNKAFLQEKMQNTAAVLLHESFDVPQPSVLFDMACKAQYGAEELMPDYVRASDAEEALESIASKLGLDAEEAKSAYLTLQKE